MELNRVKLMTRINASDVAMERAYFFLILLLVTLVFGEDEEEEDVEKPAQYFSALSLLNAFINSSLSSVYRIFFDLCSSGVPLSNIKESSASSSSNLSKTSEQLGKKRRPVSTAISKNTTLRKTIHGKNTIPTYHGEVESLDDIHLQRPAYDLPSLKPNDI